MLMLCSILFFKEYVSPIIIVLFVTFYECLGSALLILRAFEGKLCEPESK